MEPGDDAGPPPAWWRTVLAAGLAVWLAGFWFWSDATTHRLSLLALVLPGLILNRGAFVRAVGRTAWWIPVLLLVSFQLVSRLWSDPVSAPGGYWLDVLLVLVLVAGALAVSGSDAVLRRVLPALAVVAALTALLSLLVFYGDPDRSVADDRLRNVLVYEHGLNAVLTGLLCGFGGLLAAWLAARPEAGRWRWLWLAVLAVSLLGLLATQSRGAVLLFGSGFVVLVVAERRRIVPALVTAVTTTAGFFALLVAVQSGTEAARDLLGRGTTGRLDIYAWFFKQMHGLDGVVGKGMGVPVSIPADEFGWFVDHPHSAYLTQFFVTGAVGTALLLFVLGTALQAAGRLARHGEAVWLALLAGGSVALVVDGSYIFSVHSTGRLEPLLLVFPAAIAVGRSASLRREGEA